MKGSEPPPTEKRQVT